MNGHVDWFTRQAHPALGSACGRRRPQTQGSPTRSKPLKYCPRSFFTSLSGSLQTRSFTTCQKRGRISHCVKNVDKVLVGFVCLPRKGREMAVAEARKRNVKAARICRTRQRWWWRWRSTPIAELEPVKLATGTDEEQ